MTSRYQKVRRHQNPGVYDIELDGQAVATISVIGGEGRVPSLMVDQCLEAWNGEPTGETVPAGRAARNRQCIASGWSSVDEYETERRIAEEYIADEGPDVERDVRNAWRNGRTDHILTRDEMEEWHQTVSDIVEAHRAQENAA